MLLCISYKKMLHISGKTGTEADIYGICDMVDSTAPQINRIHHVYTGSTTHASAHACLEEHTYVHCSLLCFDPRVCFVPRYLPNK